MLGLLCALGRLPASAQSSPASNAPVINFRERPKYPSDTQRLRRTVQIDGVISDGEWDPFYTITEGPIKGTFYCNWDDNYLYLAARTEQPATVVFDVDMTGDGWLRGADNVEIVVGNVVEGSTPSVLARLLDASNSKDTPSWNDKIVDPKTFLIAGRVTNGTQVIELAIPKNTASMVLRPGVNMGLRAEFLPPGPPSAYTPTAPFDPHLLLDATLVDARSQSAQGINPRLTLSDVKCIAGQKLFATLELVNQTDVVVPVQTVSWSGQGAASNPVDSIKSVNVPSIPPLKALRLKYDTLLPANLPNGTYTLQVLVTLASGRQLDAAATFTVVEPVQAQLAYDPAPVVIVGPTKLKITVDVLSAVPKGFDGDAELTTFPAGWELAGNRKHVLSVDGKNRRAITNYFLKLPSNTPPGDYPIEAVVYWHNRSWKLQQTIHVTHVDIPAISKTP